MIEKTCTLCRTSYPIEHFRPRGRPSASGIPILTDTCRLCRLFDNTAKGSAKQAAQKRKDVVEMRHEIYTRYGGQCACCGENNFKLLTIDHVLNNGKQERKYRDNWAILRKILRENCPPEYQILCMSCKWGKGQYGVCPHQESQPSKPPN